MKFINIINRLDLKWLLAGCFSMTTMAYAAEPAAFLPEFVGGVQTNAIWRDANFYRTANQCNTQYKCGLLSDQPDKMQACQAQVKTCITDYMTEQGASKQAVAFARYNAIPSTIEQIKHYDYVDIVYAKMQWADAGGGFFIVTKTGFIVPAFNKIAMDKETAFQRLLKQYPNALLVNGPDNINWPKVEKTSKGIEQVVFRYPIKEGCRVCADLAYVDMAYNFDAKGNYLGTRLLKLTLA